MKISDLPYDFDISSVERTNIGGIGGVGGRFNINLMTGISVDDGKRIRISGKPHQDCPLGNQRNANMNLVGRQVDGHLEYGYSAAGRTVNLCTNNDMCKKGLSRCELCKNPTIGFVEC